MIGMYRPCGTAEAGIGMLYYLTDCAGTGGRLKKEPQDFIVREVADPLPQSDDGKYTIADVTSTNWETNRLIRLVSKSMRISREKVGFAGTKDKRAVTTQRMSFECDPSKLGLVTLEDVEFSNVFRSDVPVRMGDLKGNRFVINVRDTDTSPSETKGIIDRVTSEVSDTGGFPNYFGVQRFGIARPVTHLVGERIVKGDLKGAVETYLFHPSDSEEEIVRNTREELRKCNGDYSSIDLLLPKTMGFEQILVNHLRENPGDYKGAIEVMPNNLQMMFTHAYQSYLFNIMLSDRMEHSLPLNEPVEGDIVIPLDSDRVPMHENPILTTSKNIDLVKKQVRTGRAYVSITLFGSDSRLAEGEMGEIERKVIEEQNIEEKNFMVIGLPHCTSKGSRREIVCPVKDLNCRFEEDRYAVSFSLPKGNYATCLMREFMKSDMTDY